MGRFVGHPNLEYEEAEVHAVCLDPDKWSFFEAIGIVKGLGYNGEEFMNHATTKKIEVDLYVEHVEVSEPVTVRVVEGSQSSVKGKEIIEVIDLEGTCDVQKEGFVEGSDAIKGKEVCDEVCATGDELNFVGEKGLVTEHEECYSDSDNDSVKDVAFNDSEEERDLGLDDLFEVEIRNEGVAEASVTEGPTDGPTDAAATNVTEGPTNATATNAPNVVEGPTEAAATTTATMGEEAEGGPSRNWKKRVSYKLPLNENFVPFVGQTNDNLEDGYMTDELESGDSDSDGENKPKYPLFREEQMGKNFKFKLGMEFSSLNQFKDAILEHSVLIGKEVKFKKNDSNRVRVVCSQHCDYLVFCSRVGRAQTFRIKTLIPNHTCGRVFDNKNAKTKWVAKKMVNKFINNVNLSLNEVIDEIRTGFQAGITGYRAFAARKMAREALDGDAMKQYSMLWSYAAELRRACEGNTCKMTVTRPHPGLQPRFGSFYMCLDGCKKGFVNGCRPFIGVDGCHLKTQYGGILLIAVGRDPNDQYFPLAFAVVETECKDSWRWFLELLLEDIGDISTNRWIFMSDQQKGLMQVFDELLNGVEHRNCLRHLYNNLKKAVPSGGTQLRDLMMGAAKAMYVEDFNNWMGQIRDINEVAYNWLIGKDVRSWCKHAFSFYPKCDVLMNNLSEAFNSTILLARDRPIITMFEWIRTYSQQPDSEQCGQDAGVAAAGLEAGVAAPEAGVAAAAPEAGAAAIPDVDAANPDAGGPEPVQSSKKRATAADKASGSTKRIRLVNQDQPSTITRSAAKSANTPAVVIKPPATKSITKHAPKPPKLSSTSTAPKPLTRSSPRKTVSRTTSAPVTRSSPRKASAPLVVVAPRPLTRSSPRKAVSRTTSAPVTRSSPRKASAPVGASAAAAPSFIGKGKKMTKQEAIAEIGSHIPDTMPISKMVQILFDFNKAFDEVKKNRFPGEGGDYPSQSSATHK
ncbi:hypothetical protein RIF29_39526 [Crotalaria pallida]|uniref:MULE transposase domain-containing protein n=1 Tax=Crotalaria pallida TaxID=3830 RepID=A0AAN9E1Y7_CROPI